MRPDDREKLDQCLTILDSTDLGLSMVWLWTWSVLTMFMEDPEWKPLVSKDEAFLALAKSVEEGHEFTLEYGVEDHYDSVLEWALTHGIIESTEE